MAFLNDIYKLSMHNENKKMFAGFFIAVFECITAFDTMILLIYKNIKNKIG